MRPRRLSRKAGVLAGAAAVLVGLVAGFVVHEVAITHRTITDSQETISVEVPKGWTEAVDTEQWRPPDAKFDEAAISAGSRADWYGTSDPGEGVFLGFLQKSALPSGVPQHPECEDPPRPTDRGQIDGDAYIQVAFTGCPNGGITVERIVQVNANRLLWMQVRAASLGTANEVIRSVEISGRL